MDNVHENSTHLFGLVGRNISYSFSRGYFSDKFQKLQLTGHHYTNFDIQSIEEFPDVITQNPTLIGLNVTIPYKELIIPFLTSLDQTAKAIGAVNTIKITPEGLIGYNTDYYGFMASLEPHLQPHHTHALILGTGGASKAVLYALLQLGITPTLVSRTKSPDTLTYDCLSSEVMAQNTVIINCSPVGTYPNITDKPELPYSFVTTKHLLYDLIYNPEQTAFLKEGALKGAITVNGSKMLQLQAEKAWEIWSS